MSGARAAMRNFLRWQRATSPCCSFRLCLSPGRAPFPLFLHFYFRTIKDFRWLSFRWIVGAMQRRLTAAVATLAAAAAVLCVVAVGRGAITRSTELADVRALRPALLCGPSCRRAAARLGCFCRLLWTHSRARGAACVCYVLTHGGCRCLSPAMPFRRTMVAPAATRKCSCATPPPKPVACSRWRRRASRACSLCTADVVTACKSPVRLPFRGDRPSRAVVPSACLAVSSEGTDCLWAL